MSIEGVDVGRTCRVFTRIADLSSAVSCPSSSGKVVMFQPEGNSIRWTMDGVTTPTSTVGFLVTAGTVVCFTGDLTKVKFIQVAASATLNVSVFE